MIPGAAIRPVPDSFERQKRAFSIKKMSDNICPVMVNRGRILLGTLQMLCGSVGTPTSGKPPLRPKNVAYKEQMPRSAYALVVASKHKRAFVL